MSERAWRGEPIWRRPAESNEWAGGAGWAAQSPEGRQHLRAGSLAAAAALEWKWSWWEAARLRLRLRLRLGRALGEWRDSEGSAGEQCVRMGQTAGRTVQAAQCTE